MKKIPVGILGATGMVGQRFVTLLSNHPWFDVVVLAASNRSSGKTYEEAIRGRWKLDSEIPNYSRNIIVKDVISDPVEISKKVRLVFCALDLSKDDIINIENEYAGLGVAVVSNNSANRWTNDVPMIMPEVNPEHLSLIKYQKKSKNSKGFIVVKPNCSLQSYLPIIKALKDFGPNQIEVTTLQAISGAGKTFKTWPEMNDNVNPLISGEEDKTEREPLKILGDLDQNKIVINKNIKISATCIRVPISDGHTASVAVKFQNNPTGKQIRDAIVSYNNPISELDLPSAPSNFIKYFEEEDRPQVRLDKDLGHGMTVSCGRFREDPIMDWKFVSLSHNTIRGAAGGAILTAELIHKKGYI